MRVVAVVLSVDEAHRLRSCLPAARAEGLEVLVVDDASTDDTAAVAAGHGARVLRLERRLSYAAAVNRGLDATCDADAVLLLNADCVLRPGSLAPLLAALDDPAVGVVAPLLLREADGRVDAAGMVVDRRRRNALVGHGDPPERWSRPGPCFGADGACALLRRAALDEAGGHLDETMALWATDADLMWRLRLAGWAARFEPAAVAVHERFYAPSRPRPAEHRRLQFRNHLLMVAALAGPRDLPALALWEPAALAAVLLRERSLLPAYAEAWRARASARRRRRGVLRRARPPFGLRPPRARHRS